MKGHIRERSPSHWAIVLDIRDPETSERKRKWHSFTGTKREAQIECSRLITEIAGGSYVEPSKTTLAVYLDEWLARIEPSVAPRTFERYQEIARKNLVPLLGQTVLTKLRSEPQPTPKPSSPAAGTAPADCRLEPSTTCTVSSSRR
jgi:hypothetical protein